MCFVTFLFQVHEQARRDNFKVPLKSLHVDSDGQIRGQVIAAGINGNGSLEMAEEEHFFPVEPQFVSKPIGMPMQGVR